jgi:hypothetical protein
VQSAGQENEVVKRILRYFLRNPNAVDSLEGITRWRLLEEQIYHTLRETEVAIAWLVEQGFLDEVKATGPAPFFRLNVRQRARAVSFLQRRPKEN